MRAHLPNTSRRAVVARAAGLIAATALALGIPVAIGACAGGASRGSPSAREQLQQTFGSRGSITSGVIDVSLTLTAAGVQAPGPGLALRVHGPFEGLRPARLPRFALRLALSSPAVGAPQGALHAGATATGGRLYIALGGSQFLAPEPVFQALRDGFAGVGGAPSSSRPGVARSGLDPRAWLRHPQIVGSSRLDGVQVAHIRAGVDLARFLADARRLATAGEALLLGSGAKGSGALSTARPGGGRSARAELYVGARDHLLRRLELSASVALAGQARAAQANGATLRLAIVLSALDQPQRILAPKHPLPGSQLPAALGRLGLAPARRG